MDPKGGVLRFIPTYRIAGDRPEGETGIEKNLKFMDIFNEVSTILNISDLAGELCDSHMDLGETLGIRKLIFDIIEYQETGFITAAWYPPWVDREGHNHASQHPIPLLGAPITLPGSAPGLFALNQSLTETGGAIHSHTLHREYAREDAETDRKFLIVGLNFKSPVAQTPANKIKWTFPDETGREAVGVYSERDIGKVAFQTNEASWWALTGVTSVPVDPDGDPEAHFLPEWRSQDLESQIINGIFNARNVTFFKPNSDGTDDPFYPYVQQNERVIAGHPVASGDQRKLGDIGAGFTAVAKATQFGVLGWPDPKVMFIFAFENWPAIVPGQDFGSLGLFESRAAMLAAPYLPSDVGRSGVYQAPDEPGVNERFISASLSSISPVTLIDHFDSGIPQIRYDPPYVGDPVPNQFSSIGITDHPITFFTPAEEPPEVPLSLPHQGYLRRYPLRGLNFRTVLLQFKCTE